MIRRSALVLVPALVLGLAACGDDDGGGDAGGGGGGSTADWCTFAREVEQIDAELDEVDPFDAESIRTTYGRFRDAIGDARDIAPDEISDAIDTLYEGITRLDDELSDVDYNILDLDMSFMEEMQADMDAASDQVEAFNETECGISADDDGDGDGSEPTDEGSDDGAADPDDEGDEASGDDDFDPSAGTVREQLVQTFMASGFTEDEATCIADNLDPAAFADAEGDPTAVFEVFETCDIDLSRLAELGG